MAARQTSSNRNHDAWQSIPLSGSLQTITADQVRQLSGREPRLMMKFDHSAQLPPALREAGKFILPLRNGLYAIVEGNGYHRPEKCPEPVDFPRQHAFRLETSEAGVSEMQHLDLAFNSGLLADFTAEPALYPTLRGRKYSPAFTFTVGSHQLEVESVQIEIDQGYEGPDCIIVVEAKIGECDDFHLRQLYYPYRTWLTLSEKAVRPIFFTYEPSSGLYRFREYLFDPADRYRSPHLVKAAAYRLVEPVRSPNRRLPVKRTVPIPQADKLERVAEVPVLVALGYNCPKALADRLAIDPRQGAYYLNAACTVGLLENNPYRLSELGRSFVHRPLERESILLRSVLEVPLVAEVVLALLTSPEGKLSRREVTALFHRSTSLGQSTTQRRAQTLWAWLGWAAEHGANLSVEGENVLLQSAYRPMLARPLQGQLELF